MRFVAGSALVLGLISIGVTAHVRSQDRARTVECANNLSQLWKMQYNYMVQYGGSQKLMPKETGDAFWLKLSKKHILIIDERIAEVYQCPLENNDEGWGSCDYRGPASDVNKYADGDPVGADVDGNHGAGKGGNVLQRSGEVQTCGPDDKLWKAAAEKTTGGSKAQPLKLPEPKEETSKQRQALVEIAHLWIGIALYKEFYDGTPKTLDDLVTKHKDAKAWPEGGFYPGGKIPKDPWGRDYQYEIRKEEPVVWSWGADGKKGGSGENTDLDLEYMRKRAGESGGPSLEANERNASGSLKTVVTAQADFRSNDRDSNRANDFWTGDVAGLYCIDNASTGAVKPSCIKLIEVSIALADLAPRDGTLTNGNYMESIGKFGIQSAKAGYWYCALIEDKQVTANGGTGVYAQDSDGTGDLVHNTSRFGLCAVPESYGASGRRVFIVNEGNTMFYRDFGKDLLDHDTIPPAPNKVWDFKWPTDEELVKHWKKMD